MAGNDHLIRMTTPHCLNVRVAENGRMGSFETFAARCAKVSYAGEWLAAGRRVRGCVNS
jgi:hypothetical protein